MVNRAAFQRYVGWGGTTFRASHGSVDSMTHEVKRTAKRKSLWGDSQVQEISLVCHASPVMDNESKVRFLLVSDSMSTLMMDDCRFIVDFRSFPASFHFTKGQWWECRRYFFVIQVTQQSYLITLQTIPPHPPNMHAEQNNTTINHGPRILISKPQGSLWTDETDHTETNRIRFFDFLAPNRRERMSVGPDKVTWATRGLTYAQGR